MAGSQAKTTLRLVAVALVLALAACGSGATRTSAVASRSCAPRADVALCRPELAAGLSARELRRHGGELKVSCDWVGELGDERRRECRARVEDLARMLSARLQSELESVDATAIVYSDGRHCVGSARGAGQGEDCLVFVQASVPLAWKPR